MPSFWEHRQGVPIGREVGKSTVVPEHLPGPLCSPGCSPSLWTLLVDICYPRVFLKLTHGAWYRAVVHYQLVRETRERCSDVVLGYTAPKATRLEVYPGTPKSVPRLAHLLISSSSQRLPLSKDVHHLEVPGPPSLLSGCWPALCPKKGLVLDTRTEQSSSLGISTEGRCLRVPSRGGRLCSHPG